MAASRDVPFTITAAPAAGGCRLLYSGEYRADYDAFRRWLKTTPGPDPTIKLPEEGTVGRESNAPIDTPAQIRELAELRDAGVITAEEFESKQKDLLDRM
jgi:hypothetical protein